MKLTLTMILKIFRNLDINTMWKAQNKAPTKTKESPTPGPPVIDKRLSLCQINLPVPAVSADILPLVSAINI